MNAEGLTMEMRYQNPVAQKAAGRIVASQVTLSQVLLYMPFMYAASFTHRLLVQCVGLSRDL